MRAVRSQNRKPLYFRAGGPLGNSLAKEGEKMRNSSFELLRIVAMFAILLRHLMVHNVDAVEALPGAWSRLLAYISPIQLGASEVRNL